MAWGQLPWGTMSPANSLDYGKAYQSALSLNQANYQNVLSGYQSVLANQAAANNQIDSLYGGLEEGVLNAYGQAEQGQRTNLEKAATQGTADVQQSAISRGLTNTTVQDALVKGVTEQKNNAANDLAAKMAGLRGGAIGDLRSRRIAGRQRANDQYGEQANRMLGFLQSINSPYPDAQKYMDLARQYGANAAGQGGMGGGMQQPRRPQGGGFVGNNGIVNPGGGGGAGGGVAPMRPLEQMWEGGGGGDWGETPGIGGPMDPCAYGQCEGSSSSFVPGSAIPPSMYGPGNGYGMGSASAAPGYGGGSSFGGFGLGGGASPYDYQFDEASGGYY